MKMGFGWAGNILRVDLTGRKWWVEPTERYAERFIGGIGIGYKIFWDEVGPGVGAFDAENRLVFAPGPLTGTLAPGSGRMELVSKSPRSYPRETVTRSGMGGFWGAELKYAGYDALVLGGKSEVWVNLFIHEGGVEFRDGSGYVGEDTYRTQERMGKELGEGVRVLCIGPAGERLSRLAVILSETSFASGRSGFGAVMGSKRVKAIAVRGTKPLRVFNPDRLMAVSRRARYLSAGNPMREWTSRGLTPADQESFLNRHRKKNVGCFGCPMQCFAFVDVEGAGRSAAHCTNYYYYGPSTQFYGPSPERDRAVMDGLVQANKWGLDTYEFSRMFKWLDDLHKAGSLSLEPGLELDRLGSREFIHDLLERIALRRGVGDLLAEGAARTADRLEKGWEYGAKYFPAYGSASHGTLRGYPGVALLWALDSRDPIIDQHAYLKLAVSHPGDQPPHRLPLDKARMISRKFLGSEMAIDHSGFEHKAEMAVLAQNKAAVINLLVVCDWIYPVFSSHAAEDRWGDTSLESQLLAAVTGYELTERELDRVGERVWNLARGLMAREGRTREQDTLHDSYFRDLGGERAIPRESFEEAKTQYYRLRGWDEKTGWPRKEKLVELGLSEMV